MDDVDDALKGLCGRLRSDGSDDATQAADIIGRMNAQLGAVAGLCRDYFGPLGGMSEREIINAIYFHAIDMAEPSND